ncbi:hypothetical protein AVEN_248295-1 [Araneus ventricosus]|uniref:Uncharacterized protein n=1 Tax=Araneus ventricosus TaxID=182803 RepID=A0A4Y2FKY1_ARAVE|nr:hypothetical protein AVEN_248295-1 [Araneus ventricosus]
MGVCEKGVVGKGLNHKFALPCLPISLRLAFKMADGNLHVAISKAFDIGGPRLSFLQLMHMHEASQGLTAWLQRGEECVRRLGRGRITYEM